MFGKITKRSDWFKGFLCAEDDIKKGWKLEVINNSIWNRQSVQVVFTFNGIRKYIYHTGSEFSRGYLDYLENYLLREY